MSAEFRLNGKSVVVDAGPDFRQQMLQNQIGRLEALLLTHEHNDHVAGLDDLRPFCFKQECSIDVFGLPRVLSEIKNRYAYAFSDNPYPGVPRLELKPIEVGVPLQIGTMEFLPIPVMHGKLPIVGYRCGEVAYLTDVKTLPSEAYEMLQGVERLVISALHYNVHHSHLNLEEALHEIGKIGATKTVITHMSHRFKPTAELVHELPDGVEVGVDGGWV